MGEAALKPTTHEDYVRFENNSPLKHEFFGGRFYAMAGGTPRHAQIGTGALIEFGIQLRGRSCRPVNSEQRVHIPESNASFYPDGLVICPPEQYSETDPNALLNPRLIFEVLSPSTREFDRVGKFAAYSHIASLTDYLLFESNYVCLEHWHRDSAESQWIYRAYYLRENVAPVESLDIELALTEIYRGVEIPNAIVEAGFEPDAAPVE